MSFSEHLGTGLLGDENFIDKLLEENGPPAPELLEGSSRDRACYQECVDRRIYLRSEQLLEKLGLQRESFDLACRLLADVKLRADVEALMERPDFSGVREQLSCIAREERTVGDAWIRNRLERCESCQSTDFRWHVIRHPRRLCETCAERLAARQRSSSTNIGPALTEARRRKLLATLTQAEWLHTIAHFEDRCAYCNGEWDVVEHVTPIRKGGGTTFVNCLPACCGCNSMKRSRTLEEWIATCEGGKDRRARLERALTWLTRHGRGAP